MVAVCLLWGWLHMAGLVLLGFGFMLRPIEFLSAERRRLSLPEDRFEVRGDAFFAVPFPKTRRVARRQHSRCSDPSIIAVLSKIFGTLDGQALLMPWTPSSFRKRWNAVLSALGVPSGGSGLTPASLRGSGATDFYLNTEDLARTAWRGRWKCLSSVERYLQEASTHFLLSELDEKARSRVRLLGSQADAICRAFVRSPSATVWTALVRGACSPAPVPSRECVGSGVGRTRGVPAAAGPASSSGDSV